MSNEDTGRTRRYMKRKYGKKAFTDRGTLRLSYLRKAKDALKDSKNTSLKRAIQEAINFKSKR